MLPQRHVKDPGHSAKCAGGRLHRNTLTPLTQRGRSGLTMPLPRQSVGTYRETSSHATRQGILGHSRLSLLSHWGTDPGLKRGISVRELISTLKKKGGGGQKKKWGGEGAQAGNELSNILPKSSHARKKPPQPPPPHILEPFLKIFLKFRGHSTREPASIACDAAEKRKSHFCSAPFLQAAPLKSPIPRKTRTAKEHIHSLTR